MTIYPVDANDVLYGTNDTINLDAESLYDDVIFTDADWAIPNDVAWALASFKLYEQKQKVASDE